MEKISSNDKENILQSIEQKDNTINRENIYLLSISLVLGLVFNILFYKHTLGVSYPAFVLTFYGLFIWKMKDKIVFKVNFGWLLSIPVIMLSLTYVFFTNPIFRALNFLAIPLLIVVQTLLITGNNKFGWHTAEFIYDIFYAIFVRSFSHVLKPFELVSKIVHRRTAPGKYAVIKKIFTGLLISLPLILVIVMLLASADDVFRHWVGIIPGFFIQINLGDFVSQALIMLVVSTVLFSYLWSLQYNRDEKSISGAGNNGPFRKVWDPVIVITILIVINIIYVLFTLIQFTYLFGSVSNILPPDVTFSEYARRGFFELVLVTLINLSILLASINLTKREGKVIDKTFRLLSSLLVICTLVMLLSAHSRMLLYEWAYGFTYLRVLTHTFMAYIFALLVTTLVKAWNDGISLLKWYIVISIMAYLVINYVNIDALIAQRNIERYRSIKENKAIDTYYLTCLSYDAVPFMVELLNDKDKDVARDIENYLYDAKEDLKSKRSWQSFNLSEYRAKSILSKYELDYEAKEVEYER
ncbi:MAG: DUF4153 domain-containing protein [Bacillota bacterium]